MFFSPLFLSSRCMLELKFAISLRIIAWPGSVQTPNQQWMTKGLLVFNRISNSAIFSNNYVLLLSDLYACIQVKKLCCKWSHGSSVTSSNHLRRLQSCEKAMGWCTVSVKCCCFVQKTIMKESHNFELASLKKKKEKHFGHLATC